LKPHRTAVSRETESIDSRGAFVNAALSPGGGEADVSKSGVPAGKCRAEAGGTLPAGLTVAVTVIPRSRKRAGDLLFGTLDSRSLRVCAPHKKN